ncbi:hypothetical protein JF737_20270 [Mycobacterium avium]|uniref:hypothetical protein n=1 Tax=Mycobacterium avium TaxID=1764 RepID=UPI001CD9A5FB|nr:hypothetical protein [Mycobacterium avium]MCA2240011.1 hypothetical protein [Mycobacterium avium]MCA2259900.1 hypothetical protein [Mycobacterium avium]MCA2271071.1 hypothetical protein [Mycobacterium avium]MCA2281174.1 hypothetical protein [Mycobacterium avium]MCA2286160.1 hypothetical protein [Mycobacterium avium]
MIEKPPSPHGLIGDHWPEIDELGIAKVATALANAGTGAGTAEQKSYQDGTSYQALLPEGFETQVDAAFKVGGMAADLSGWFTKCATETGVVAEGVALGKLLIAVTTMVAEAVIASKEAEIAALQLVSLRPEVRAQRIQQLRSEIKQITDDAKDAIQELYEGIYTPTAPASPGLQPLIHNDQPFPQFQYGQIVPAGSGTGSETGKGDTSALDNPIPGTKGDVSQGMTDSKGDVRPAGDGTGKGDTGKPAELSNSTKGDVRPAGLVENSQPSVASPSGSASAPSPTAPSTSGSSSAASGLSSMGSAMPKMPSTPSAPSGGGLGGGSGLSGLGSGGGASASPASLNPTQQFLNGAAQGFSQSPVATGASAATAAAQPFRPPAGSTMQTSPAPLAPTAPAAATPSAPAAPQQVMTSSPSGPVGAGTPPMTAGGGGVPLAPPPTAGVPNAAPPPSPVAPPPAAAAPPGGGGGGPVSGPPPGIMNLGGKNAALKAMQMGAHTVGEGLRSTPEFSAAMALVAALNDPERPAGSLILGGWSCAVFGAGASMRFVVAERHGLSWIPAGVYLPAGVTVAHLDERVPADVRHSWRGLDPSALVLAEYAKAIGEQPRIVVARAYHPGMPGWFGRDVVLAADEASRVIIPNPLHEPGGRHRLELAAPEHWRWVMSLPDAVLPEEVQAVAQWLVGEHDQMFAQWPDAAADAKLRALAVSQIGREGGAGDVKQLLAAKMGELATRLIGAPNYGTPQWGIHTGMEMALRGWEALLLSLGSPSRTVMADIQYAVLMATQPILPPPIVVAAGA